jgi:hypothetical protein
MPRPLFLALPLALALFAAWPAPSARAIITTEEYVRLHGGPKVAAPAPAPADQERAKAPAGTIRTEDGAVFTVPKAQDQPDQKPDGGGKTQ